MQPSEAALDQESTLARLWQRLVQDANVSTYVLDAQGTPMFANPAFEALWGVTVTQLWEAGYNILRDPQLVANGMMPYLRKSFDGEPSTWPIGHYDPGDLSPTSRERFVEIFSYPVKDEAGQVVAVTLMHHDVTERERLQGELARAYQALRERAERGEAEVETRTQELNHEKAFASEVLQNVPTGVAYLDRQLVYRVANPAYAKLLQLQPHQVIDRYLFDVVPGGEDQILSLLRGVIETRKPFYATAFPFTYLAPDGSERHTYFDFIYHPAVLSGSGQVDGVLVVATEVSERVEREREQRAFQSEREALHRERIAALEVANLHKDQFLGVLSHELRTPLNAIQGFGSVLEEGIAGDLSSLQAGFVGKILTASDQMLALIDDLLDLSRMQAGRFGVNAQPVALAPVSKAALVELATAAMQRGLVLAHRVPADLPLVQADAQRVRQVMLNLVGNALKFTPEGGTILVSAEQSEGYVKVSVEDTGTGIAPGEQDRVFQSFTQVDMTNTRQNGGAGLGLSIVKAIVEAHGGQVGVESVIGIGSVFWFTLPLAGDP